MAGNCLNAADRELLIYVSVLSGRFRHDAWVKNRRNTMSLGITAAGLAIAATLAVTLPEALYANERDDMRHAVERGEIHSLAEILAALRGKLPGEVAGVEIERKNGRWFYEFRVIDNKGRLFEVYVDARTAVIERMKEK
ncbi:MAG TPA: PepSY domain-containing protein [Pseudolabrys sp.]|nr:PepSY domain-containing protein [Pseudolabrys sp.]